MTDDDHVVGRPPFREGQVSGSARGSFRAKERMEEAPDSLPEAPDCPFCDGVETELMSAFGAHASVSTYWCRVCRSPFELMRWR
ncbi:MAG: hypothetical protein HKN72_03400 [Gemmatimonadetes bacterium]|nr:hypothetical protein [Gemmatimonadota bacterium]